MPNVAQNKLARVSPILQKDKCSLQWRHKERDGVSNHWRLDCLLNSFAQVHIKENIKAQRHWPMIDEFSAERTSNAENVFTWWHHHIPVIDMTLGGNRVRNHGGHYGGYNLGAVSIRKTVLPGVAIPMLKIRRPNGRLIFNIGIAIPR